MCYFVIIEDNLQNAYLAAQFIYYDDAVTFLKAMREVPGTDGRITTSQAIAYEMY